MMKKNCLILEFAFFCKKKRENEEISQSKGRNFSLAADIFFTTDADVEISAKKYNTFLY